MKKFLMGILILTAFLAVSVSAHAFTLIDDPNDDAIGTAFETDYVTISNIYADPLIITLSTVYPENGLLVGGWQTEAADIFLTETYLGDDYSWAIPLG